LIWKKYKITHSYFVSLIKTTGSSPKKKIYQMFPPGLLYFWRSSIALVKASLAVCQKIIMF